MIVIGRGDEVEPSCRKPVFPVLCGLLLHERISHLGGGLNSVMEILSMHQETRGQFPKEITKAREVMERPFG